MLNMEVQMLKRILSMFGLLVLSALLIGMLTAVAPEPAPNVTFTLISGLPATMKVGDTATVVVQVSSDQEFLFAAMLPTFFFPGRGVVATNAGGDRVGSGTSATLAIPFIAKEATAEFPSQGACPTGGVAAVAVVAGAHYPGGFVATQRFPASGWFCVAVLP
jgi:hypothetical protein